MRIEKTFGLNVDMPLRMQAWLDTHAMWQRAGEIDVKPFSPPGAAIKSMNKYLVTRAVEWFDGVRSQFWRWLFDEERENRRLFVIVSFCAGSLITNLAPEVWWYAKIATGLLIITAFVSSFLLPVAYFVEWVCRRLIMTRSTPGYRKK